MRITVPFLLVTGAGALLLWCGITDRNPTEVLHAVFTGKTIPGKGTGAKPASFDTNKSPKTGTSI